MLQKIENFYLAILRVVVIAVAGLLLAAVVYFGFNSIGTISSAPKETPANPQVSSSDYKKALMGEPDTQSGTGAAQPAGGKGKVRDEYLKAAKVLSDYYAKRYAYPDGLNENALVEWYSQVGETYSAEELNHAFAAGFLVRVTEVVADPNFSSWELQKGAEEALSGVITTYKTEFDKQIEEVEAANERAEAEHAAKRAESMQMIYVAGAAFLAFLLIVFLSIIIRIERNLRPQPQA